MRYFIAIATLMLSTANASTSDYGKITQIYLSQAGTFLIQLDNGFPNAESANECPGATIWAGIVGYTEASRLLGASIMMANASNLDVRAYINGCSGNHYKLDSIFIDHPPSQ